ncbi:MAG: four helix bundle protein [Bacteroidales bacterium]|nr:four helix bundle protein [Bacteroidales bacterium]
MDSPLQTKSFLFATRIINLARNIKQTYNEYDVSRQIIKSGTSIGANIRESRNAQSPTDFISKLSIALKEADETQYWLELINACGMMSDEDFNQANAELKEIIAMLTSSIKTVKNKL